MTCEKCEKEFDAMDNVKFDITGKTAIVGKWDGRDCIQVDVRTVCPHCGHEKWFTGVFELNLIGFHN